MLQIIDTAIQRFLIKGLGEILPGAAFFGEEDTEGNAGADAECEFTFYIDRSMELRLYV